MQAWIILVTPWKQLSAHHPSCPGLLCGCSCSLRQVFFAASAGTSFTRAGAGDETRMITSPPFVPQRNS